MHRLPSSLRALFGLLCLGAVLTLGAIWGSGPLIHDDLFFHLGTGRWVADNHAVPSTDIFSFTRAGVSWVSHEWGFGLVSYVIWSLGEFRALVAFKAVLVVAILALLFWIMLRRSHLTLVRAGPILAALLAVGLWAIHDQLVLRASLVSSLFILILMLLLDWFDDTGSKIAFATIVGLFLAWGNIHGEVLFGLFLLGVSTVEAILHRYQRTGRPLPASLLQLDPDRPYLRLLLLSLLATQINPNGVQVLLYPFRLAGFLFMRGDTLEMGHFGGATPAAAAGFYLLIALLLLGSLPLERLKTVSLTEALTVTAFLVLSLRSHRFIFFFTLFALPLLARLLAQRSATRSSPVTQPQRWATALGVLVVVVAVLVGMIWQQHATEPVSRHFPAGAVRFLEAQKIRPRMFNHQNFGGYLGWSLGVPVYWDGRNLLFESLMQQTTASTLAEVSERWQLDTLVLAEREYRQLVEQLDPSIWALVQWDDDAALYLHHNGPATAVARRLQLTHWPPFGGMSGLEQLVEDPVWVDRARRELDQVLHFEPHCQRALYFHGLVSYYSGELERAESELRHALEAGPPNSFILDALARVLESLGRFEESEQLRRQAIDARP